MHLLSTAGCIYGGHMSRKLYPYTVTLRPANHLGGHFCGGVIIDEYFILTAATCLISYEETSLSILSFLLEKFLNITLIVI